MKSVLRVVLSASLVLFFLAVGVSAMQFTVTVLPVSLYGSDDFMSQNVVGAADKGTMATEVGLALTDKLELVGASTSPATRLKMRMVHRMKPAAPCGISARAISWAAMTS